MLVSEELNPNGLDLCIEVRSLPFCSPFRDTNFSSHLSRLLTKLRCPTRCGSATPSTSSSLTTLGDTTDTITTITPTSSTTRITTTLMTLRTSPQRRNLPVKLSLRSSSRLTLPPHRIPSSSLRLTLLPSPSPPPVSSVLYPRLRTISRSASRSHLPSRQLPSTTYSASQRASFALREIGEPSPRSRDRFSTSPNG